MVTHLLRTHLFMEPIAVASYRQLPTIHPVWKLLAPHIRGVLAINTLGRDVLIAEGGVADNTLTVGGGGKTITHSVNLSPGRSNYQVSGLNCSLTHVKNKDIYHIFWQIQLQGTFMNFGDFLIYSPMLLWAWLSHRALHMCLIAFARACHPNEEILQEQQYLALVYPATSAKRQRGGWSRKTTQLPLPRRFFKTLGSHSRLRQGDSIWLLPLRWWSAEGNHMSQILNRTIDRSNNPKRCWMITKKSC